MCHDIRLREAPVFEESCEQAALDCQRDILVGPHFGVTIAEEIKIEDLPVLGQVRGDTPPDDRRERCPVQQDERWCISLAEAPVTNRLAFKSEGLANTPKPTSFGRHVCSLGVAGIGTSYRLH